MRRNLVGLALLALFVPPFGYTGEKPEARATSEAPDHVYKPGSPPFKVDQHGSIGLAFLVGPVVDAEDPGCGTRWNGQTTQQPQQGVATDGQAQGTAQSHPRPAPQRQGDMCQPVDQSLRAPRPWGDQRGKPLGKHAARAATIGAEELPPMQVEHDVPWSPREIGHRADIATVDTPRRKPADWTMDPGLRRRHLQRQLGDGVVHLPGIGVQLGCIGKQVSEKDYVYP